MLNRTLSMFGEIVRLLVSLLASLIVMSLLALLNGFVRIVRHVSNWYRYERHDDYLIRRDPSDTIYRE